MENIDVTNSGLLGEDVIPKNNSAVEQFYQTGLPKGDRIAEDYMEDNRYIKVPQGAVVAYSPEWIAENSINLGEEDDEDGDFKAAPTQTAKKKHKTKGMAK